MMDKHFQYRIEYLVLKGCAAFLNSLPYRLALGVAWFTAGILFHVCRFRRRETFRRIREAFPRISRSDVHRIAWGSLRNMSFNMVEMMRAPSIDKTWIDTHMPEFQQKIPAVKALLEKHGGLVVTVPHSGNWDLAGWACNRYGINMFSVAAKQKNPFVNAWINRQRENGITILERGGGTLKQIIKLLRSGNAFAILPDVRMPIADLDLPFLGHMANFGRGMAMFAITAGVPIVPAIFRRVGWTHHTFDVYPTLYPDATLDRATDARRLTATVTALVDEAIRKHPEQWFWYNKRWILTPVSKN